MGQAPKKAETLVREVEAELADTQRRIEQERDKREAALLADDTNALDAIEVTQSRLQRAAQRQRGAPAAAPKAGRGRGAGRRPETACGPARAVGSEGFGERRPRGRGSNHGGEPRGVDAQDDQDKRRFAGGLADTNSHTDVAAGSPEGAALSGSAIRALLSYEFYRASADPMMVGVPGERRQPSLPGAVCPRLDWQLTPDKITPFADAIQQANKFGVETMGTTLDPLQSAEHRRKLLRPSMASAPQRSNDCRHCCKQQAELANDISPEGEAKYMAVVAELAKLSNEPQGAQTK